MVVRMSPSWIALLIAVVGWVGTAVGWVVHYNNDLTAQSERKRFENAQITATYLTANLSDLVEASKVKEYLDKNYSYQGTGILESYVYNARAKHGQGSPAELQIIETIEEFDRNLRFRVKSYLPCAITPAYREASFKFLKYVDIYLKRAGAIELLAKLPAYDLFPVEFKPALESEIKARQTADVSSLPGLACIVQQVPPHKSANAAGQ
jgi:hypothetical protein